MIIEDKEMLCYYQWYLSIMDFVSKSLFRICCLVIKVASNSTIIIFVMKFISIFLIPFILSIRAAITDLEYLSCRPANLKYAFS
jgi:hypothetical protein